MATTKLMTAAELAAMADDGFRYELIRGVPIRMPPPGFQHGKLVGKVFRWLDTFVVAGDLGQVVTDAGFLLEEEPDILMAPDVAFVRAERLPPEPEQVGYLTIPPDLAVEVISPSESAADVAAKVAEYHRLGVPLVWAFFPRRRVVGVFRVDRVPREVGPEGEVDGEDILPGFRLPVAAIFPTLP